jgi:hypothetical protein
MKSTVSNRRSFSRIALLGTALLAVVLQACGPMPTSNDAWSAGGGTGRPSGAHEALASEHESLAIPRAVREPSPAREATRVDSDVRPPRVGVVFCRQCQ